MHGTHAPITWMPNGDRAAHAHHVLAWSAISGKNAVHTVDSLDCARASSEARRGMMGCRFDRRQRHAHLLPLTATWLQGEGCGLRPRTEARLRVPHQDQHLRHGARASCCRSTIFSLPTAVWQGCTLILAVRLSHRQSWKPINKHPDVSCCLRGTAAVGAFVSCRGGR